MFRNKLFYLYSIYKILKDKYIFYISIMNNDKLLLDKAKAELAKIAEKRKICNKKYYLKKKLEQRQNNKDKYCDHCKKAIRCNSKYKAPEGYGTLHKKCYEFKRQLEQYKNE